MRKSIATLAVTLGLAGVIAPFNATAAHAAPECIGSVAVPPSYVCIVRRDLFQIDVTSGPVVHTVPFCALVICVGEQAIPLVDITVQDNEIVVLYYMNKCYYVGNGTVTTVDPVAGPADC